MRGLSFLNYRGDNLNVGRNDIRDIIPPRLMRGGPIFVRFNLNERVGPAIKKYHQN